MAVATLRYSATPPDAFRGGIVCIGNFDGVHRGHAVLLRAARALATPFQAPVVAVTFEPHPLALLAPERFQPPLTTTSDRATLLHTVGADHVVVLQTTPELLALSPEYFFETIIQQALHARGMVEGFNFRFGHQRAGDNELLRQLCHAHHLAFDVVPEFALAGQTVSSSLVRDALVRGDISTARTLLNRDYTIRGTVAVGAQRGRTLGFPTANLEAVPTLLPCDGVYAVGVRTRGTTYLGAANVGPNPTFGEQARKIEIHLLDFHGDLYGTTLDVAFYEFIRPTRTFADGAALIDQLRHDVDTVRRVAANRH